MTLLMFGENVFPPIPSDLIMPLAGFAAARGDLDLASAVLAEMAGFLLGATLWYHVGRRGVCARLKRFAAGRGRWLTLSPEGIDRDQDWLGRHGGKAVMTGRLVPGARP